MNFMNVVFSAQKLGVIIDACILDNESVLLQQVVHTHTHTEHIQLHTLLVTFSCSWGSKYKISYDNLTIIL